MAKFTFNDLMTKIYNIFKSDLYIINNKYCIGGNESEEKNITHLLCILNDDCSKLVKDIFPDNEIVYIKDVKKIKDNIEDFSSLDIFETEKNDVIKRRDIILNLVLSIEKWKDFNFTKDDINNIFNEGKTFELFTDDNKIPSVIISKSLFPMIKENTIDKLYYQIFIPDNENDLVQLITSFDTDWFQIYNLIQYIKTDDK